MGRIYSASFSAVAVTAIQDFIELNAASDSVVIIHSIVIGQDSDAADAEAEMIEVTLSRSTGTSGSGGTTATAHPHNVGDSAFGGTVEVNNTTQATTTTVVRAESFNIQAGYFYQPTPEERIVISPSGRVVLELIAAPTDSLTMNGTIVFEEIGG